MLSERTATQRQEVDSEPFHYEPTGASEEGSEGAEPGRWNGGESRASTRVAVEQRERAALQRGSQEGEARARAEFAGQAAQQRAALSASLEAFKAERASYFARIEPEVVQLSLAIARKILHREAQLDPLLLAGMVHVALEKLERGTQIRLRAHPEDMRFWI